jgi:hypothetical protein
MIIDVLSEEARPTMVTPTLLSSQLRTPGVPICLSMLGDIAEVFVIG